MGGSLSRNLWSGGRTANEVRLDFGRLGKLTDNALI